MSSLRQSMQQQLIDQQEEGKVRQKTSNSIQKATKEFSLNEEFTRVIITSN